ncbi:Magnesium and cobalt efflux protein CorC [Vibrio aerogenes CECT 7868]|uniref:Magnesium and cobalt efflux protein CorC n=1 Tax=Vibrio aerogenes CECT 7868 TaxID=1216006 RepID=A0A1M5ZQV4_9VIBR|nr:hemolysin family protein [Vibrio aerogenes]SHI26677.1 Magnesium and cobalt efflux protein CorC [Vibrio aerogenes CECT 7868]
MEIIILMALILLNGILAMSEIALVTAKKNRLQKQAEEGDKAAAHAIRLGEEPTQFLSTVQIGITAIGLLNGIFGESALAGPLATLLQHSGFGVQASTGVATTIVVIGITYITIVIGELVPKRLAQTHAEKIARMMAFPVSILATSARPFVFLLARSTDFILFLCGERAQKRTELTEEDIEAVLDEGSQTGLIDPHEHEMVRNALRLDERKVTSLMTPRSETIFLDASHPVSTNLQTLLNSEHAWFPVCKGGFEHIQGITSSKHLLRQQLKGELNHNRIADALLPAVYIPENWNGTQLLEHFRDTGDPMVFIVDEYGDLQGIVTALDLLEALTGEFKNRHPEDSWSVQNEDGSWMLDGLIPIVVVQDILKIKSLPGEDEEKGAYHTLGGMLMWLFNNLPEAGDQIHWQGWQFEVMTLDGNRIDKVRVIQNPEPDQKI